MTRWIPATILISALAACSSPVATPGPMPGSDRDVHGCIGSAGYSWCARTQQCERPWELAAAQKFDNTGAAYDAWCKVPPAAPAPAATSPR